MIYKFLQKANKILQQMKQETNFKKQSKNLGSAPQTRRSMIARQQNPAPIYQPNIDDILAFQFSDTLINTAYYLSVTSISVSIHKLCDPLQKLFIRVKAHAYENIYIYSNRSLIQTENKKQGFWKDNQFSKKSSHILQIEYLNESKMLERTNKVNDIIILTKEQRIKKLQRQVKKKLKNFIRIINKKLIKIEYESLVKIQGCQNSSQIVKKQNKNQIQVMFQRYQQSRIKGRKFNRRSIDKQIIKKPLNQSSFSLNKDHLKVNRLTSPVNKNNNVSKNQVNSYLKVTQGLTDKKASTCSQTQSNNSLKDNSVDKSRQNRYNQKNPPKNPLSRLKSSKSRYISPRNQLQQSKVSPVLKNGSFFADGTKQRQLQLLRGKYYRLVEQFKDFSDRFLQVIKEQ